MAGGVLRRTRGGADCGICLPQGCYSVKKGALDMSYSSLEILESRIAPAGLITVEVTKGGMLLLGTSPGEDGDEVLTITRQVDGTYLLTPGADVTLRIDGQDFTTPQAIPKVQLGLVANLGEGDDQLFLTDVTFAKDVKVNLGDGNDQLSMQDSVMAKLTVTGLDGNDTVTGFGSNFGAAAVKVNLGDGNDTLNFDATTVAIAAGIQIDGGEGNDSFVLGKADGRATVHGGIRIKGGEGNNTTTFGGANALVKASGPLQTIGGGGDDVILFGGLLAQFGAIKMTLGDGTNQFTSNAEVLHVGTDFRFAGGAGFDKVDVKGITAFIGRTLLGKLGEGSGSFTMRQDGASDATLTVQGSATVSVQGDSANASDIRLEALGGITLGGAVKLTTGDGTNTISVFSLAGDIILGKGALLKTGKGAGSLFLGNNSSILCNGPLSLIHGGSEGSIFHNSGTNRGSFVKGPLTMLGSALISSAFAGVNLGPVRIATSPEITGSVEFRSNGQDGRYLAKGLDILVPGVQGQTSAITISGVRTDQSIRIRGGAGNDTLNLNGISLQGSLIVDLLDGADQFKLEQEISSPGALFFGTVLLKGGAGADTFLIGGNNAGQEITFQNRVILDGGDGTDSVTIGTLVTTSPDFSIEQKNVP
jgi:hypothetical protein